MLAIQFLKTLVIKITSIKQLLITTLLLKKMKMSHIFQAHSSIRLAKDKLFGSIPLIVLM